MSGRADTVFLRIEGVLQSWGDASTMVVRRTMDAPTKSGVLGMLCCAMGLARREANEALEGLRALRMAARIDRPGERWWDYHTVGAATGILAADGSVKTTASTGELETLISRREYLADASFLVALQGDPQVVDIVRHVAERPIWPFFLGRKSCPPSAPILASPRPGENWANPGRYGDLLTALSQVPWSPRRLDIDPEPPSGGVPCLVEWVPTNEGTLVPADADIWYDNPVSFCPPAHEPRVVLRTMLHVTIGGATLPRLPAPPRLHADYKNHEYRVRRVERLSRDHGLCVFCKAPATTVQHITYRRAGGNEALEDLRSLCRLCHDAVTMLEYGHGMGIDRINPEDPKWRELIIQKRRDIIRFRSLETRRRRLSPEEVE